MKIFVVDYFKGRCQRGQISSGRSVRPHAKQILGTINGYGGEGPSSRGSKPQWCELVSFNSSGKPQLMAALKFLQKRREDGVMVAAAAVQEHHAAGSSLCDLQFQIRKVGWKLNSSAALVEGASRSAGVGVCVRAHIESGRAQHFPVDMSPHGHPGRVAAVFVDGVFKGGLIFISLYLYHTEGFTARNLELLTAVGVAIKRWGGAWVIGGDFNMTPDEFREGADEWLDKLGGEFRTPGKATCTGGAGGGEGRLTGSLLMGGSGGGRR